MHPFLEFPKSANRFKPESSFEHVMILYRFDKKLRLLMFNEIEKIEVTFRTAMIDECTSIMITDRINLNKLIRDNINAFQRLSNIVGWADKSETLRLLLQGGKKIIVSTFARSSQ